MFRSNNCVGPAQSVLHVRDSAFIRREYPKLDFILNCSLLKDVNRKNDKPVHFPKLVEEESSHPVHRN